jgi:hypothetical protein
VLFALLSRSASPATATDCVLALLAVAGRCADRIFVGLLFEGLKAPMSGGEATKRTLQALQTRFPAPRRS